MYTIYRNVRVISVQEQEHTRTTRPEEIADSSRRRNDRYITVATFSGVPYECTIGDFKDLLYEDHGVSIAVDENWNVIAAVNHTTGERGSLKATASLSEILGILFLMAIPILLSFFIARKAWNTISYYSWGWPILGVGVGVGLLILLGASRQYRESRKALQELLNGQDTNH